MCIALVLVILSNFWPQVNYFHLIDWLIDYWSNWHFDTRGFVCCSRIIPPVVPLRRRSRSIPKPQLHRIVEIPDVSHSTIASRPPHFHIWLGSGWRHRCRWRRLARCGEVIDSDRNNALAAGGGEEGDGWKGKKGDAGNFPGVTWRCLWPLLTNKQCSWPADCNFLDYNSLFRANRSSSS